MDISNYIASVSMAMSNVQQRQSVNIATLKLTMETQDTQSEALAEILQTPSFGHQMDIRA